MYFTFHFNIFRFPFGFATFSLYSFILNENRRDRVGFRSIPPLHFLFKSHAYISFLFADLGYNSDWKDTVCIYGISIIYLYMYACIVVTFAASKGKDADKICPVVHGGLFP